MKKKFAVSDEVRKAVRDYFSYNGVEARVVWDKRLVDVMRYLSLYMVECRDYNYVYYTVVDYDPSSGCANDANFGNWFVKDKEALIRMMVDEKERMDRENEEARLDGELIDIEERNRENVYVIRSDVGTEWEVK